MSTRGQRNARLQKFGQKPDCRRVEKHGPDRRWTSFWSPDFPDFMARSNHFRSRRRREKIWCTPAFDGRVIRCLGSGTGCVVACPGGLDASDRCLYGASSCRRAAEIARSKRTPVEDGSIDARIGSRRMPRQPRPRDFCPPVERNTPSPTGACIGEQMS